MMTSDFNFIAGSWDSRQRRLVNHWPADDWYEFDATLDCGAARLRRPRYLRAGARLRGDHASPVQPRRAGVADLVGVGGGGGQLDVPVVGRSATGWVRSRCDDTFEGTPIRCATSEVWSDTPSPVAAAFSPDGGQTWEVNWMATFRRRS
jgi:hypothetical protein